MGTAHPDNVQVAWASCAAVALPECDLCGTTDRIDDTIASRRQTMRIHELYKANMPITDAIIAIQVERLIEAVLLVCGIIGGLYLFSIAYSNEKIPGMAIVAAWIRTGFFVMLLTSLDMSLSQPQIVRKIVFKIAKSFTKRWDNKQVDELTLQIDETINRLYLTFEMFANKAKIGLIIGFLLTILFLAYEYAIVSVFQIGLDWPPNYLLSLLFQLIIAMILMVPTTPGGAGIAEISCAAFCSLILPSAVVGVFVVLLQLVLYYSNLLVGFVASFLIVRREATNKIVEIEFEEGEAI
jgi:uncharacterized protein (TIRG00374 family)